MGLQVRAVDAQAAIVVVDATSILQLVAIVDGHSTALVNFTATGR